MNYRVINYTHFYSGLMIIRPVFSASIFQSGILLLLLINLMKIKIASDTGPPTDPMYLCFVT